MSSIKSLAMHCLVALAFLAATDALADANSAKAAYFQNREKLSYEVQSAASSVAREDTLVRGVYRLEDRASGRFIALITERGDLKGDSTGWTIVGPDGPVDLTDAQARQLRQEVMSRVRWDQLIRVTYGDGGARRLILVSAVNCPYCRKMEANLAKSATTLRTTFYVLPSSLTPLNASDEGQRTWSQAADLWCAHDDGGASWKAFWVTHQAPRNQACPLDAASAQQLFRNFGIVMASIGVKVRGTPALIREDGEVFGVPPDFDADYASKTYGPAGMPATDAAPAATEDAVWLTAPRH
ncbi:MAG: hypothetical protein ABI605_12375 [Rhizobacter sp.]